MSALMDRLQAMHTFVRVVETGSFSAAGRESGATQSAVSKQVAGLEALLGARLLARSTRSLTLTEEGARYFEQARRLVAEVAEAEETLRRGAQQLRGWLRVAAPVAYGRLHLLPVVRRFLREHPDVKLDLQLHDGFVDLVEQGVDVAVRVGELADSGLLARRIGTTRRALMATAGYLRRLPKGTGRPREPEDLLAHDCIDYTGLAARNDWVFAGGPTSAEPGAVRTVAVQGSLRTNSSEVVREAILAGMGIGFAPRWLLDGELAAGKVATLMPDWTPADLPIHLVSPRERRQSAKVRAFGDAMARALTRA